MVSINCSKRLLNILVIQFLFSVSLQTTTEAKIPLSEYNESFRPPQSFFSPFGQKIKTRSSTVKQAQADLKVRGIQGLCFLKAQSGFVQKKEKNFYIFAPKLYSPGINQDEFWIYVTDTKGNIETAFKYFRKLNEALVSESVIRVPIPISSLKLYKLAAQARSYEEKNIQVIEAANVYAKSYLGLNIFYVGADRINSKKTINVLTFSDTSGTDKPILFFVDGKSNKIFCYKPFNPSDFVQESNP